MSSKYQLGEVILEREFETHNSDGKSGVVTLRVGKPQRILDAEGELSWRCPHQIVGIGPESVHAIPGIDALDALLSSLKVADAMLEHYSGKYQTAITWLGEEHLGLPKLEPSDSPETDTMFETIYNEFFGNLGKKGADRTMKSRK